MTFTADNLPEAARSIGSDFKAMMGPPDLDLSERIDLHTVTIFNRLDAALNGRLSALLNGTAPVEPDYDGDMWPTIKSPAAKLSGMLDVFASSRPAVDPVRFALEKVTSDRLRVLVARVLEARDTPEVDTEEVLRAELAKILPVAELLRESEAVAEVARWREMSIANRDAFAAMRNAINEHVPIQSDEADLLKGPEFSVSCEAVARAVIADVARLKSEVLSKGLRMQETLDLVLVKSREIDRLTKERDDWRAKASNFERHHDRIAKEFREFIPHADALEALLTVDGVKTWEDFEVKIMGNWEPADLVLWVKRRVPTPVGVHSFRAGEYPLRQTPAPEPELKRWRVRFENHTTDELITKRMTRADAEKIGEVIGEA